MHRGFLFRFAVALAIVSLVAPGISARFLVGDWMEASAQSLPASDLSNSEPTQKESPAPTKSSSSTPAPTCSPEGKNDAKASQIGTPVEMTVCLGYRSNPGVAFPPVDGGGKTSEPVAGDTNKSSAFPKRLNKLANLALLTDASKGIGFAFTFATPQPGATVMPTPASGTMLNGVPFSIGERRVAIVIDRQPQSPDSQADLALERATRLVIEVNQSGACNERSPLLTDDLFSACTVAANATPKPSPTPTSTPTPVPTTSPTPESADALLIDRFLATNASPAPVTIQTATPSPTPTPTPTPTPNPADSWPTVTIPFNALNELYARPLPGPTADPSNPSSTITHAPVTFLICEVEVNDRLPDDFSSTVKSGNDCFKLIVRYTEPPKFSPDYKAGAQQSTSSTSSASGNSPTLASQRSHVSAQSSPSATATASPTTAPELVGTFTKSFNAFTELSAQGQYDGPIFGSLIKETSSQLTSAVSQQLATQAANVGNLVPGLGTDVSNTSFISVDTDILGRVLPSPYHGIASSSTTLTNQPQAFDYTDVLDLKPFDVSVIKTVTAGAKLSSVYPLNLGPQLGVLSLAWFHDSTLGMSGSIFHFDQTFTPHFSFGFSEVVGNTVTPPTNKYVAYPNLGNPAYPSTTPPNPVLHSTNTVAGAEYTFGNAASDEAAPGQVFARFGTTGYGRDWLGAVSYGTLGQGTRIKSDGTSLSSAFLAGYRAIDYSYTPLLTNYNPLAGNQIYFGRANFALNTPGNNTTPATIADRSNIVTSSLSVAVVYAEDGGVPEYRTIGASQSIPLNKHPDPSSPFTLSVSGAYLNSYISSTVLARQSGSGIVAPGPLNLLNNDAATFNFQIQSSKSLTTATAWSLSATAGIAAVNSPKCTTATTGADATTCSSSYSNKITWSANAGNKGFVLYATGVPGSIRSNPTSITPTIPSSTIVTSGSLAYHYCFVPSPSSLSIEPSFTITNNIAQDGSAFQPGTLLEVGADIGPSTGIKPLNSIIRLSYENAINATGTPVALKNNGFAVQLVSASQALWQLHKTQNDPCQSGTSTNANGT